MWEISYKENHPTKVTKWGQRNDKSLWPKMWKVLLKIFSSKWPQEKLCRNCRMKLSEISLPASRCTLGWKLKPPWHEARCLLRSQFCCGLTWLMPHWFSIPFPLLQSSHSSAKVTRAPFTSALQTQGSSQAARLPGQSCYVGPGVLLRAVGLNWRQGPVFIPATNSHQHVSDGSQVEIHSPLSHGGNLAKKTTCCHLPEFAEQGT